MIFNHPDLLAAKARQIEAVQCRIRELRRVYGLEGKDLANALQLESYGAGAIKEAIGQNNANHKQNGQQTPTGRK